MTETELNLLRSKVDSEVTLEFTDGKVARVQLVLVDDDEHEIVYDFVPPRDYCELARFEEIRAVRLGDP